MKSKSLTIKQFLKQEYKKSKPLIKNLYQAYKNTVDMLNNDDAYINDLLDLCDKFANEEPYIETYEELSQLLEITNFLENRLLINIKLSHGLVSKKTVTLEQTVNHIDGEIVRHKLNKRRKEFWKRYFKPSNKKTIFPVQVYGFEY